MFEFVILDPAVQRVSRGHQLRAYRVSFCTTIRCAKVPSGFRELGTQPAVFHNEVPWKKPNNEFHRGTRVVVSRILVLPLIGALLRHFTQRSRRSPTIPTIPMNNDNERLAAEVMAAISGLPFEQQQHVVHTLLGVCLKKLPVGRVEQLRADMASEFDPKLPVVEATLNLIDGHLALRRLAKDLPRP